MLKQKFSEFIDEFMIQQRRVKKYLGVEIGVTSGSTSRSLTAFFFGENGIIYLNKLCALEFNSYKKNNKLDNYNNMHELIARNW